MEYFAITPLHSNTHTHTQEHSETIPTDGGIDGAVIIVHSAATTILIENISKIIKNKQTKEQVSNYVATIGLSKFTQKGE